MDLHVCVSVISLALIGLRSMYSFNLFNGEATFSATNFQYVTSIKLAR